MKSKQGVSKGIWIVEWRFNSREKWRASNSYIPFSTKRGALTAAADRPEYRVRKYVRALVEDSRRKGKD